MTRSLAIALSMVSILGLPARAQSAIDRLGWLTGCWEMTRANGVVEEQWTRPRAGTLFGLSRTIRGDSVMSYEFLRLFLRGDTAVYESQPSGQPKAEFKSLPPFGDEIVFSNPTHDFPQRIIYRRVGADSLVARIEGTVSGKQGVSQFPYRRVACPR
jgi:hypothetical protein